MSTYRVVLTDGTEHVMLIPYKNINGTELLRRLSLKNEWACILICTYSEQESNHNNVNTVNKSICIDPQYFPLDNDVIIPSNSTVKVLRRAPDPMIYYYGSNDKFINKIKKRTENLANHDHILVWMNYNVSNNPIEPLQLTFIHKQNYLWRQEVRTSSFEEFNDIINKNLNYGLFLITSVVYDRFEELYKAFG